MHMTNKKRAQKEKNDKSRGYSPMNTGTRNMGFESNNARKAHLHIKFYE